MQLSMLIIVMTMRFIRSQESLSSLTTNYDMFGRRMAVCDNATGVIAQNEFGRFAIHYKIFSPDIYLSYPVYTIPYNQTDDFVQSVAPINQRPWIFVYIGENLDRTTQFIGMIDVYGFVHLDRQQFNATYRSATEYYQYSLGIDPQGLFAYIIGNNYSYIYDLSALQLTLIPTFTFSHPLRSTDFVILDDNTHALLVGYSLDFNTYMYFRSITLLLLQPPNGISLGDIKTILPDAPEVSVEAVTYSPVNDLSVAVNDLGQVLIGVPMYNSVVFASVVNDNITFDGNNISWSAGSAFGKDMVWLDNTTFAALAYSASGAPWASSQLLIFDVSSPWPIFAFPNNQQPIGGLLVQSPSFLRLGISRFGGVAILLNSGEILALSVTSPGIHTTCIMDFTKSAPPFYSCPYTECPSGTYKQSPSLGPCYVCPPGTKNPKKSNITDIECEPCAPDTYCSLAGIDDVPNDPYTLRITQALNYPESPESTIFDDILIQNMFRLQINPPHCLLISPLFWTLMTVGLATIILTLVGVLRIFTGSISHYLLIKRIFRQTDLIGEGELWIGGLFSFSIVILVSFAYAFSSSYLSLYPIETASNAQLMCDKNMRNAKFSTGVRLLSVPVDEEEAPIFELLDAQVFTLSIDFLNTVPACNNIVVTQTSGANEIPLERYICTNTTSAIATISLQLPMHELTISVVISDSYSIGALRMCLIGPELVQEQVYTLRSLNFCEFFGTTNQTLSYTPEIAVSLTKVINKTQPLANGGQAQYSGLFIPTIVTKGLSDAARYARFGDYLRYLPTQSLITIDLSETQFYLKNTQEPIARQAEIVFHSLLFTIVTLELFELAFLFFKLSIVPLFRLVVSRRFNNNRAGIDPSEDENSEPKENVIEMKPPPPQVLVQVHSKRSPSPKSVW